ncbi:MAG: TRAP transporter small permease [Desulfobacterales bacterium]|nr:TRAP transporter small permease [Desulfobacterales bacterium]
MNKTARIWKRLESIQSQVCVLLLVLMSLLVVIQVFSRYLFNFSFVWLEELVRYLMIWMVMIGAALVQANNDHIRIDFFPMLAGPRGKRIMETLFRLCTLLFVFILLYKGVKAVYFNRLFESSGLRISMLWPTLAIPLGALLVGLYTGFDLLRDLNRLLFWSKERLLEEDRRLAMEKVLRGPADQKKET